MSRWRVFEPSWWTRCCDWPTGAWALSKIPSSSNSNWPNAQSYPTSFLSSQLYRFNPLFPNILLPCTLQNQRAVYCLLLKWRSRHNLTMSFPFQEAVLEKFRQGVFGSKKIKTKNDDGEVVGEESVPSPVISLWKEAVKDCTTFSRMHVLLGTQDGWYDIEECFRCIMHASQGELSRPLTRGWRWCLISRKLWLIRFYFKDKEIYIFVLLMVLVLEYYAIVIAEGVNCALVFYPSKEKELHTEIFLVKFMKEQPFCSLTATCKWG